MPAPPLHYQVYQFRAAWSRYAMLGVGARSRGAIKASLDGLGTSWHWLEVNEANALPRTKSRGRTAAE
jgi:hypothetical protein